VTPAAEASTLDLAGLPDLLGFHLRLAHVAMYRDFMAVLSDLDLTQKQCATLQLIGANPAVSQVDIAATLGTDRATMMAMVDRLEERGLVVRTRSQVDRRRRELHLTPEGQSVTRKAVAAIQGHESRFKSRLTKSQLESLMTALRAIHRQV
jgi:DNA-binding MarR family transcriptional regulator